MAAYRASCSTWRVRSRRRPRAATRPRARRSPRSRAPSIPARSVPHQVDGRAHSWLAFRRSQIPNRTDRKHPAASRAARRSAAGRGGRHLRGGARRALRSGGARHHYRARGDRLPRDHRRRAAQVSQVLRPTRVAGLPNTGLRRLRQSPSRPGTPASCRALTGRAVPLPDARRLRTSSWPSRWRPRPVKQAVISPSALSLLYPSDAIAGYSREQFIDDLLAEARDRGPPLPRGRARTTSRSTSPRGGSRSSSTRPAGCSQLHRPEQPGARPVLRRGAQAASASIPAPEATTTRRTAPTSTTPRCYRSCSSSRRATSMSQLAGEARSRPRALTVIRDT